MTRTDLTRGAAFTERQTLTISTEYSLTPGTFSSREGPQTLYFTILQHTQTHTHMLFSYSINQSQPVPSLPATNMGLCD